MAALVRAGQAGLLLTKFTATDEARVTECGREARQRERYPSRIALFGSS